MFVIDPENRIRASAQGVDQQRQVNGEIGNRAELFTRSGVRVSSATGLISTPMTIRSRTGAASGAVLDSAFDGSPAAARLPRFARDEDPAGRAAEGAREGGEGDKNAGDGACDRADHIGKGRGRFRQSFCRHKAEQRRRRQRIDHRRNRHAAGRRDGDVAFRMAHAPGNRVRAFQPEKSPEDGDQRRRQR